ncbi:phosphate signaling complex protein PhoU [Pseudothermotoga sp.]|uniref:phosphate signaling complex protein PhoU n=1 Tax=Pseudothermotoga sp. TaxID=2033661 RepID=UPI0031F66724
MTERTKHYEKEVSSLNMKMMDFLVGVENLFEKTLFAIQSGDENTVIEIEQMDDYFDALDMQIQQTAFDIIAKYQPLADDLRFVVAMIGLSIDLERIADECVNIAQLNRHVQRTIESFSSWKTLNEMIKNVLVMFQEIVEAVRNSDLQLAIKVWQRDDEVDKLHTEGHEKLIELACGEHDPRKMRIYLEEAFLIRHLERIADHITNVAEKLYFIKTGEQLKVVMGKKASNVS